MRVLLTAILLLLSAGAHAQERTADIIFPGFLDLKLEPGDRIIPHRSANLIFVETPERHKLVMQRLERYRSLLQAEGWTPVPNVRGAVLRLDAVDGPRCVSVQDAMSVPVDAPGPTSWGVTFHRLGCSELRVFP
jgi:hypothetical protein